MSSVRYARSFCLVQRKKLWLFTGNVDTENIYVNPVAIAQRRISLECQVKVHTYRTYLLAGRRANNLATPHPKNLKKSNDRLLLDNFSIAEMHITRKLLSCSILKRYSLLPFILSIICVCKKASLLRNQYSVGIILEKNYFLYIKGD
jgi:hypothetical protein